MVVAQAVPFVDTRDIFITKKKQLYANRSKGKDEECFSFCFVAELLHVVQPIR